MDAQSPLIEYAQPYIASKDLSTSLNFSLVLALPTHTPTILRYYPHRILASLILQSQWV